MGRVVRCTGDQRTRACRHELAIDLAYCSGAAWPAISALRCRWSVDAVRAVPQASGMTRFGGVRLFVPPEPCAEPRPSPLAPSVLPDSWPPERFPIALVPGELIEAVLRGDANPLDDWRVAWYLDL